MTLDLSVILATPDEYGTIRKTVQCLGRQAARKRLELIVVAPSAEHLNADDEELSRFGAVQVVEDPELCSTSTAKCLGIRAATASVVVFAEDHAFPEPGWAKALIEAHRGCWSVVGPVVLHAEPGNLISWADVLIGYGRWLPGAKKGEVEFLPGHNSAYKRSVLLEYGSDLPGMLDAETVLHWDLRRKGHRLYLEPAARIAHMSFGRLRPWTKAQCYGGRLFASQRAQDWSLPKRLFYLAASPLIPAVRLGRVIRLWGSPQRPNLSLVKVLPALAFGLLLDGVGQACGYAFGTGDTVERMTPLHFHRDRHGAA